MDLLASFSRLEPFSVFIETQGAHGQLVDRLCLAISALSSTVNDTLYPLMDALGSALYDVSMLHMLRPAGLAPPQLDAGAAREAFLRVVACDEVPLLLLPRLLLSPLRMHVLLTVSCAAEGLCELRQVPR